MDLLQFSHLLQYSVHVFFEDFDIGFNDFLIGGGDFLGAIGFLFFEFGIDLRKGRKDQFQMNAFE